MKSTFHVNHAILEFIINALVKVRKDLNKKYVHFAC